jgi:hypothetical protein
MAMVLAYEIFAMMVLSYPLPGRREFIGVLVFSFVDGLVFYQAVAPSTAISQLPISEHSTLEKYPLKGGDNVD